jgi:transitional endoplasmic reticulum ATPase
MNDDSIAMPAKLLKVARADGASGQVHARQLDGRYLWFTVNNGMVPEKSDVILLYDNHWEPAPHELWPVHNRAIAIVRYVTDDGNVVIEEGVSLRQVANPRSLAIAPGNTVELDDDGVAAIISDTPMRSQHFDREPADIEAEFRVFTDGNGPSFADFGGYPEVVERARKLIDTQMLRQKELKAIGARPVKGVLFTGPPGTGKTHLARIIAHESGANFYLVSGPTVVSKWVGDSEDTLRKIFEAAESSESGRAIIFFDEIDSIAERRSGDTHEASRRLVAQLLTLMDGFGRDGVNVVVIAATNRADALDPALTRPGRFDWEIEFGMPTLDDRYQILEVGTRQLRTSGILPLEDLAQLTNGWSAAQLSSIWAEAALLAAAEGRDSITAEDAAQAYERAASRPRRLEKANVE